MLRECPSEECNKSCRGSETERVRSLGDGDSSDIISEP
jgi:hypothetical protein